MDKNRPVGHGRNVTGSTEVHKRGEGLGTGPVGTGSGRKGSGSSGGKVTRAAGFSGGGLIVIVIIFFLIKSFFGGGGSADDGNTGNSSGNSSGSSLFGTLLDGDTEETFSYSGNTTAKLDTTVAAGAREKRTKILGNGKDVVTIMVYMCGTDLESKNGMATADLKEMTSATIGKNVNLIVYTGGCTKWKNDIVSSSKNQIYQVKDGGLYCLEKDMGTASMTNPDTLTEFIKYCKNNFPADRNELIFWDHGGGSISGYGYDEKNTSSGSMTLAGINKALKNAGTTFDFIGFDACLMATLETALTVSIYADYLIGSEETEPGVGWYYTNWLTALSKDTSKATIEIGKQIVDDFVDVCAQKCPGQKTTLSVVDLAELEKTVPSGFTDFAKSTNRLIQDNEYKKVSEARNNTREYAVSSKIDQVDLVNLCENLNTSESNELARVIKSSVKYNRHSDNMGNSNGLAIYFPYKKVSNVSRATAVYDQIGMDSEYSRCIKEFAGLEVCGQQTTGGSTTSPLSTLLGGSSVSSSSAGGSIDAISSILGGILGGGSVFDFLSDRSMTKEDTAQYLSDNYFDPDGLVWTKSGDDYKIVISDEQWSLVQGLDLNVFLDDGSGFIDLGLDNVMEYDIDGNLIGTYDNAWVAINNQVVAYYHTDTDEKTSIGYVPIMLNDERAELIVVFENSSSKAYVAGARRVYKNGETDTIAKNILNLENGDKIDFLCDYYDYEGNYKDSYYLGDSITVNGDLKVSYMTITNGKKSACYRFTDIYQQTYWTPVIP